MTTPNTAVLNPLELGDFFSNVWEKSFRHISRSAPSYFDDLINIASMETFFSTREAYYPAVQVVHNEREISRFDYTDDTQRINPQALAQHYHQGATLIISEAHKHFPALASLCRQFSKTMQMRCQTNVYLSPPKNQGFRSHYDTHDVFILQVNGSKTFRFYRSDVALPFPDDQYDPEQNPHTEVEHEVTLNAGDTLYIPRGLVHDALAQNDEPSLHITLGVFPVVVRDILQSAVQIAAESDVRFRTGLVPDDPNAAPTVQELKELITAAISSETIDEARTRALDDLALDITPESESLLSSKPLSLNTTVSIKTGAILGAEFQNGSYKLRLFGQVVSFNEPMASAVEFLVSSGRVNVDDLPDLDQEQCLALCNHLIEANALNVHL